MHGAQRSGQRTVVACVATLAVALLGFVGDTNAQFDELIPIKIGIVRFGGIPAVGKLYRLVSVAATGDPSFQLPTADPATTGGKVTVMLVGKGRIECTLAAQPFDGTEGWKTLGPAAGSPKGYKYINTSAPGGTAGPCKLILVKEKVIKVIAKGTGSMAPPEDNPPGNPDIETVLTLGPALDENYCARAVASHFKEKKDRLIKATNQPKPGACPVVPGTTTTSTTGGPSTTSTSGTAPSTTSTSVTLPSTTTTTTAPSLALDHYRLYGAAGTFINPPPADLADQFQVERVNPDFASGFMVPVEKNLEGITDPISHLTCYPVQGEAFAATVDVANQFGHQTLSVGNPQLLCAPTQKLDPSTPGPVLLDHYKCYEALGDPPQVPPVSLGDQFQIEEGVLVLNPFLFCNPADKNEEGISNSNDHLTCYLTESPLAVAPGDVIVFNQFDLDTLDVLPPVALCVPSEKLGWTPVTTTTTEPPQTTTTTTTPTATTTTTTLPVETLCCEFPPGSDYPGGIPACLDAWAGHMPLKCDLLGGLIQPGVCDPVLERCVNPPVAPSEFCCQCPVQSPPFPNPQFCFETTESHVEIKCVPPCSIVAAATCDPVTEECISQ